MNDSDSVWEEIGRTDPYYGVLTEARYSGDLANDDRSEFFRTGERHAARVLDAIREGLAAGFAPSRALDYGCGVGRVAIPLARLTGAEVVGADVSPSMLDEAERNARSLGVAGTRWVLADDDLSAVEGQFDLVHSYIVLQHVPVHRGERIIRALLSRLAPGGVVALQFPYAIDRTPMSAALYWARTRVPGMNTLFDALLGRPRRAGLMLMNAYSLDRVADMLHDAGCLRWHVRYSEHQVSRGVLLFAQRGPAEVFL